MKFVALRIGLMSLALSGSALAQDEEDYYDEQEAPSEAEPERGARRAPPPGYAPRGYASRDEFVPLATLPATRPYRSNRGAPEGYVLSDEPRRGLVVAGVSVVGAAYFSGLVIAGVIDDFPNQSGYLAIPVFGPWITLAARTDRCSGDGYCSDDATKKLLAVDGLFQAIGAGLFVTGLVWTRPVWLREDLAKHIDLVPGLNVATLPGMPQPQGMSVVGRF
jgi:hypothetical protein